MNNPKNTASLQEKFSGCLLGGAVGDALGFPTENLSHKRIQQLYGWVRDYHIRPSWGYYTDDTQMAIALAEVLVEHRSFVLDAFRRKLARWIIVPPRLGGGSTKTAAWRCLLGLPNTGQQVPGTSGAMRIAPLALAYHMDLEALLENVVKCCQVTHTHPSAIAGAVLSAFAVAYALNHSQFKPEAFLDYIATPASHFDSELAKQVRALPSLLEKPEEEVLSQLLVHSNVFGSPIADVILVALYAFLRTPDDFEQSVLLCVNAGWDTDTMACICAHISGAWNGVDAIPPHWREHLENGYKGRDYILKIAQALYTKSLWQENYHWLGDYLRDLGRNTAFQLNMLTRKRMW